MPSKNKTPVVLVSVTGPYFLCMKIIHIPSMVTVHTVQVVQYDLRVSQMAPNCLLLAESLGFAEHTVVIFVWNGLKNIRPANTWIAMFFTSSSRYPWQLKKINILGVVLKLSAKKHCLLTHLIHVTGLE